MKFHKCIDWLLTFAAPTAGFFFSFFVCLCYFMTHLTCRCVGLVDKNKHFDWLQSCPLIPVKTLSLKHFVSNSLFTTEALLCHCVTLCIMHGLWLVCYALGQGCNLAQPTGKALVSHWITVCTSEASVYLLLHFICFSDSIESGMINPAQIRPNLNSNCLWINQSGVVPEKNVGNGSSSPPLVPPNAFYGNASTISAY